MSILEPSLNFDFIETAKIDDHTTDWSQLTTSFLASSARLASALCFDICLDFAAYQIFYFTGTIGSYLLWGFAGPGNKPQLLILAKTFDQLYISRTMVPPALAFV